MFFSGTLFDSDKEVAFGVVVVFYGNDKYAFLETEKETMKSVIAEAVPNCKIKNEYININEIKLKVINSKVVNGIDTACIPSIDPMDTLSIPYDGNPIFNLYEGQCGEIKPSILVLLKDAAKKHPEDWIRYAFKIASANNIQHWAYIEKILLNWEKRGKMSRGYKQYKEDEFSEFFAN